MAEGTKVITISNQVTPSVFDGTFITGWHVPSKTEWETLETYLGGTLVAGGKLKLTGIVYWLTPNTGATNEVGFNGKNGGWRLEDGEFADLSTRATFWSSTEKFADTAYVLELVFDSAESQTGGDMKKTIGNSVRLLKDSTTLTHGQTGTVTDFDGNIYPTICIGTQEYMAENLRTKHYADGTLIPMVVEDIDWAALSTAGMCHPYDMP